MLVVALVAAAPPAGAAELRSSEVEGALSEAALTLGGPVLELVGPYIAGVGGPELAAGPESWILSWSGGFGDACRDSGIFARRFDLRGLPLTPPFRVDTPVPHGEAILPSVAAGLGGGFLVAWHDVLDREVHARTYDADDRPGADRIVNTYRQHWQIYPDAQALPAGGYSVGWVTGNVGDDGVDWPHIAHGQLLDPQGRPVGEQFRLNGQVEAFDREMRLLAGPRGLLPIWIHFDHSGPEIWVRPLSREGRAIAPDTQVVPGEDGPYGGKRPACALPDGGFLLAFPGGVRRIGPDGTPGPIQPAPAGLFEPWTLACGRFGEVLAAYRLGGYDDPDTEIIVQRLSAEGAPLGEPLVVNGATGERAAGQPAVAVGPGGQALVAWSSRQPFDGETSFPPVIEGRRLRLGAAGCVPSETDLCLLDGRYRVRVAWSNPYGPGAGIAAARPLTGDVGAFWFFREGNLELMVKVLDGSGVDGHHWVFTNALSTVEHWIEVTDTVTGASRLYHSPAEVRTGHVDTAAFDTAAFDGAALHTTAMEDPRAARTLLERSIPAVASAGFPTSGLAPSESGWPGSGASPVAASGTELAPRVGCVATATRLCLGDGRFAVEVAFDAGSGPEAGRAVPLPAEDGGAGNGGAEDSGAGDTGAFWFFVEDNLELLVKVLDGQPVNGHFWISWAGLTTLPLEVRVTDLATGETWTSVHPGGELGGVLDTEPFAGDEVVPGARAVESAPAVGLLTGDEGRLRNPWERSRVEISR